MMFCDKKQVILQPTMGQQIHFQFNAPGIFSIILFYYQKQSIAWKWCQLYGHHVLSAFGPFWIKHWWTFLSRILLISCITWITRLNNLVFLSLSFSPIITHKSSSNLNNKQDYEHICRFLYQCHRSAVGQQFGATRNWAVRGLNTFQTWQATIWRTTGRLINYEMLSSNQSSH